MASIIIDGYNLIGVEHRDVEAQRKRLIEAIAGYGKGKSHSIVVVFDGWKSGRPEETRTVEAGVTVVYSRLGERADSVIKRMMGGDRQHIVVTSDRDVQAYAWSKDCVPIGAEEFQRVLNRVASGTKDNEEPVDDDEEGAPRRKGRPVTPSKKDKAVKRALNKL